jgi:hypothetical protein
MSLVVRGARSSVVSRGRDGAAIMLVRLGPESFEMVELQSIAQPSQLIFKQCAA